MAVWLIKGLRVETASDRGSGSHIVKVTDKNGFALFRRVRPGSYHVRAEQNPALLYGAYIEVKLDGPTDVTVPLEWPGIVPVPVRSLKGTIRGPDYLPGESQQRLSIDLLDGGSGRILRTLETDDHGAFTFQGAVPGRYILSLKPWITGRIWVAVDRNAPTDRLDLDIGWSSCGLYYSDTSTCTQPELQTEEVSGRVVDSGGAAISRAKILLLDPAGAVVQQLQCDEDGNFVSSGSVTGTYQLVVSSTGFTPYRRTVHVKPASDPARRQQITVQLGALGRCSSARVR
jgi:carboxypeptidase family protein